MFTTNHMATMNFRCFNRHFSLSSQPLCPIPIPRPSETHLWYVIPDEVNNSSLLNRYMEILSPCEKQNVLSYREDELKKRALLSRALVRSTIARYQSNSYVDPSSIKFKKNLHGKPEVDWQCGNDRSTPPLHFNISHSSSLIACGITNSTPIGIDVEEKNRNMKNDVMSFARRFFSPLEVEHLDGILDPDIQRHELMKLWTLKESYVKALGTGFSKAPFNTFTIRFNAPKIDMSISQQIAASKVSEIIVESTDAPNSNWNFALLELAGTNYAAICTHKDMSFEEYEEPPMALRVWKTVPLVEDSYMSETSSVVTLGGFVRQLKSFTD